MRRPAATPYIIKGLIAAGNVSCIVGAPGAGKSVLAPSLAYAVAQGREAHGRRTKAGLVFYVNAEDESGMRGRVRALREEHGKADNFRLVSVSDLLNEVAAGQGCPDLNALREAVEQQRPSLIVIDTIAAAFPSLEENSSEGMGRVVAVARSLSKWGAAVLLIHHDTKDGQQGLPRGHSLLNGALDLSLHLKRDGDIVRGRLTKNRNGPCDVELAFSVKSVEAGHDEDGDTVTAPLCIPLNANALKPAGPKLKRSEKAALESIREMMGDGDEVALGAWREAARDDARITTAEKPDNRRRVVSQALQGLVDGKVVKVSGDVIRFPEDRIEWRLDDLPDDNEVEE